MRFFFCVVLAASLAAEIPAPAFRASLFLEGGASYESEHMRLDKLKKYQQLDPELVAFFQNLYEIGLREANAAQEVTKERIPRIVHQIWLGKKPISKRCKRWMSSWFNLHGWEYRLWTDEEMGQMKLYNRDLYETATCYAEKADIARLEILHRYGGIYADIDYECIRPELFEELHRHFDFYVGIEPLEHGVIYKYRLFKFCNAIFGSIPRHPLLESLIVNLKANYFAYENHGSVLEKTGPSYLTRIICEYEKTNRTTRNIYLPCSFLYPFSIFGTLGSDSYLHHPERVLREFPEAAGVHYWEGSWRPEHVNLDADSEEDHCEESWRARHYCDGFEKPHHCSEGFEGAGPACTETESCEEAHE